jgi:hypothetical protein
VPRGEARRAVHNLPQPSAALGWSFITFSSFFFQDLLRSCPAGVFFRQRPALTQAKRKANAASLALGVFSSFRSAQQPGGQRPNQRPRKTRLERSGREDPSDSEGNIVTNQTEGEARRRRSVWFVAMFRRVFRARSNPMLVNLMGVRTYRKTGMRFQNESRIAWSFGRYLS